MVYLGPDATWAVSRVLIGFKSHDMMCVGIYVLEMLSMDELRAVFYHEFAHISNVKPWRKRFKSTFFYQVKFFWFHRRYNIIFRYP